MTTLVGKVVHGVISGNTNGDNTILAASATETITVVHYVVVPASAVGLRWKSGSNNKSGLMSFAANSGGEASNSTHGVLQLNKGEDWIMELDDSVQVSGHYTAIVGG